MGNRETGQFEKAKSYAFLLLKFRPRSEYEITQRLKNKKFQSGIIGRVVSFLKEKEFLDDRYFCRAWVQSRLKKPFGINRIRQELRLKGIEEEVINSQIASAKEGYCEDEIINKVAREKFAKAKNIAPDKAKRRIFAYLARRGFSLSVVAEAVKKL